MFRFLFFFPFSFKFTLYFVARFARSSDRPIRNIESFKARSGLFVPIRPGFASRSIIPAFSLPNKISTYGAPFPKRRSWQLKPRRGRAESVREERYSTDRRQHLRVSNSNGGHRSARCCVRGGVQLKQNSLPRSSSLLPYPLRDSYTSVPIVYSCVRICTI